MGRLAILALLLAAIVPPATAFARPAESYAVIYKSVTGTTANQLIASLNKHRTQGSWAFTYWKVTRVGCRTTLTIRQTLPVWQDSGRAPAVLRRKWNGFHAALLAHEARHLQFARSAAAEIDAMGCSADPVRVLRKWIATERAFDRRTQHGIKTGATLRYE
ncbi:MAG: DUF922 domain-containing protein [Hyphomicrobiales bacterium]